MKKRMSNTHNFHRDRDSAVTLCTATLRLVVIIVLGALVLSGCVNPLESFVQDSGIGNEEGSLSITIGQGIGTSTWQPQAQLRTPHKYVVSGVGPLGAELETTIESIDPEDSETIDIPALLAGTWSISVDALNEGGVRIATGSDTTTVSAGEESSLSISLRPTEGYGNLSIAIDWTSISGVTHSDIGASAALYEEFGSAGPVTLSTEAVTTDSWTVNELVPAGSYIFEFALTIADANGDLVDIYTIREAVRILGDGLVTEQTISVTDADIVAWTDIGLLVSVDGQDPVSVSMNDPLSVEQGEEVTISAVNVPNDADLKLTVEGTTLAHDTGSSIILPTEDLPNGVSTVVLRITYQGSVSLFSFRLEIEAASTVYAIGGPGPAGGIVFHDKGDDSDGWRYLEAWTEDEGRYRWKTSNTGSSGTSTETGSGFANTYTGMSGTEHTAAEVARNASHGGFNDWFLPSKDELDLMFQRKQEIGHFEAFYSWSSSENVDDDGRAWAQWFGTSGFQTTLGKTNDPWVRVIRRF